MSIIYARRIPVKSTPIFAPKRTIHRPFGEGLDTPRPVVLTIRGIRYEATVLQGDDSTAVVRLAKLAGKGEVYDVSRGADGLVKCDCPDYEFSKVGTSSTCKHGTAVIEAGLIEAPAPVKSDNLSHLADLGERIPASVRRIRVTSGSAEGIWHWQPSRSRWVHETDFGTLDFSGTVRWLAADVANAWYVAGRVAILPDRDCDCRHPVAPKPAPIPPPMPKPTPTPAPAPALESSRPTAADLAWHLGFTLGSEGDCTAAPSASWPREVGESFLAGLEHGSREYDHDMDIEAERYQDLDSSIWGRFGVIHADCRD